jgi:hypothetical protein
VKNTDRTKLNRRQLAVLDDLFAGDFSEQQVLDKHKLNRSLYNRWLADERFCAEFDRRIGSAHRQSAALIARYGPLAAAKLVQLTDSEKEETARKACLDIISLPMLAANKIQLGQSPAPAATEPGCELSPQTAGRLLAALAEEKQ